MEKNIKGKSALYTAIDECRGLSASEYRVARALARIAKSVDAEIWWKPGRLEHETELSTGRLDHLLLGLVHEHEIIERTQSAAPGRYPRYRFRPDVPCSKRRPKFKATVAKNSKRLGSKRSSKTASVDGERLLKIASVVAKNSKRTHTLYKGTNPKELSFRSQKAASDSDADASVSDSCASAAAAKPNPKPKSNTSADFAAWWELYPRRGTDEGKAAAARVFPAALKLHGLTALTEAAQRYRRYCEILGRTGGDFVKKAVGFLNDPENILNEWTVPANGNGQWSATHKGIEEKARELGIAATGYDSYETLKDKCIAEIERRAKS